MSQNVDAALEKTSLNNSQQGCVNEEKISLKLMENVKSKGEEIKKEVKDDMYVMSNQVGKFSSELEKIAGKLESFPSIIDHQALRLQMKEAIENEKKDISDHFQAEINIAKKAIDDVSVKIESFCPELNRLSAYNPVELKLEMTNSVESRCKETEKDLKNELSIITNKIEILESQLEKNIPEINKLSSMDYGVTKSEIEKTIENKNEASTTEIKSTIDSLKKNIFSRDEELNKIKHLSSENLKSIEKITDEQKTLSKLMIEYKMIMNDTLTIFLKSISYSYMIL